MSLRLYLPYDELEVNLGHIEKILWKRRKEEERKERNEAVEEGRCKREKRGKEGEKQGEGKEGEKKICPASSSSVSPPEPPLLS